MLWNFIRSDEATDPTYTDRKVVHGCLLQSAEEMFEQERKRGSSISNSGHRARDVVPDDYAWHFDARKILKLRNTTFSILDEISK